MAGGSSNAINFDGFDFDAFQGKPLDTLIYITHPNFKSKLFIIKHTETQLKNGKSVFELHVHCEAPNAGGASSTAVSIPTSTPTDSTSALVAALTGAGLAG